MINGFSYIKTICNNLRDHLIVVFYILTYANIQYLKDLRSLTSNLSDLSSRLEGLWAKADASGRKATGCWRYVPFEAGTLNGHADIWKELGLNVLLKITPIHLGNNEARIQDTIIRNLKTDHNVGIFHTTCKEKILQYWTG